MEFRIKDAWVLSQEKLIECLDNDAVELGGAYPFDTLSEVQHFNGNSARIRGIKTAYMRAGSADPATALTLIHSMFHRLERDETALNWALHFELTQGCYLAGNDLNVINLVKSLPPASKLALVLLLGGLRPSPALQHTYEANLDTAISQICDLCAEPQARSFQILPTDTSLLGMAHSTTGDPHTSAISHNASALHTLPKTLLIRAYKNSFLSSVQTGTRKLATKFHMAAAHQLEILTEINTPGKGVPLIPAIKSHLRHNFGDTVSFDDFTSTQQHAVVGGFLCARQTGHERFAPILYELEGEHGACAAKFMRLLAHSYAMADRSDFNTLASKILKVDPLQAALSCELDKISGLPLINNFLEANPARLTTALIDDYLDFGVDSSVSVNAYRYLMPDWNSKPSRNFQFRLLAADSADGMFYEYGLVRLALGCKEFLAKNLGIVQIDDSFDNFCQKLGVYEVNFDNQYQISRKLEAFELLPERFKTAENKLFLGGTLSPGELDSAPERVWERALAQDMGL
ncbi:hypothetical protein RBE51_22175 [Pseudomonas taiwanensis]|uniref:hypothetical protein n=1 Tax=Pseudomonas taiwanensis TaxID=470150 RepID=UPI0028DDEAEE|nr:hypothetical protein [Pseudomonas taiwanensis]MDT8925495.1 hypothetical protein [Pseudomonas taiwanensis]